MRKLLYILLILIHVSASAQTDTCTSYTQDDSLTIVKELGTYVPRTLITPATQSLNACNNNTGAQSYVGGVFLLYDGSAWVPVSGGTIDSTLYTTVTRLADSMQVVRDSLDSISSRIGSGGENIANANLTANGDHTLDYNGYGLDIIGLDSFVIRNVNGGIVFFSGNTFPTVDPIDGAVFVVNDAINHYMQFGAGGNGGSYCAIAGDDFNRVVYFQSGYHDYFNLDGYAGTYNLTVGDDNVIGVDSTTGTIAIGYAGNIESNYDKAAQSLKVTSGGVRMFEANPYGSNLYSPDQSSYYFVSNEQARQYISGTGGKYSDQYSGDWSGTWKSELDVFDGVNLNAAIIATGLTTTVNNIVITNGAIIGDPNGVVSGVVGQIIVNDHNNYYGCQGGTVWVKFN